ncbi:unnamed protein product, partial [Protopolystoma xenopodis]
LRASIRFIHAFWWSQFFHFFLNRPITLVVAKCWDSNPKGGYFTIPRQEPVRPIDPRAWVLHTNAMTSTPVSVGAGAGNGDTSVIGQSSGGQQVCPETGHSSSSTSTSAASSSVSAQAIATPGSVNNAGMNGLCQESLLLSASGPTVNTASGMAVGPGSSSGGDSASTLGAGTQGASSSLTGAPPHGMAGTTGGSGSLLPGLSIGTLTSSGQTMPAGTSAAAFNMAAAMLAAQQHQQFHPHHSHHLHQQSSSGIQLGQIDAHFHQHQHHHPMVCNGLPSGHPGQAMCLPSTNFYHSTSSSMVPPYSHQVVYYIFS